MKTELLYFEGCPTWREPVPWIEAVVRSQGAPAEVEPSDIKTTPEAIELGFLGSPSIRFHRADTDPAARASIEYGLNCRLYRDGDRSVGVSPRDLLERPIREVRDGQDCCSRHS